MESALMPCICAAGLILLGYPVGFLFWYWIIRKGWLSVRLFALCLTLTLLFVGLSLWIATGDKIIFWFTVVLILASNLVILTMPRTNPSLMKLLRMKW